MRKIFLAGSKYYFTGMPEFDPEDTDKIEVVSDNNGLYSKHFKFFKPEKKCIWQVQDCSKEEHFKRILEEKNPHQQEVYAAKFLIKEFSEFYNVSAKDLKELSCIFDRYKDDNRYSYQYFVYKFYLENNGFFLTDEQREICYKLYKSGRERYKK